MGEADIKRRKEEKRGESRYSNFKLIKISSLPTKSRLKKRTPE